jgi:hypothetical protein
MYRDEPRIPEQSPPSRRPVMNGDMPLDDERQTKL